MFSESLFAQQNSELLPSEMKGVYEGMVKIYRQNVLQQEVVMKLEIDQDSIERGVSWVMTYGEGEEESVRPYSVRTINAAIGHFEMDEHNGIVLHMQKVLNKYYSYFHVENSLIEAVYTFQDRETIISEIKMYHNEVSQTTGDNDFEGEKIPAVKSFPLQVYQMAILKAVE